METKMESIVLMDTVRIQALGIFITFTKKGDEVEWHSPDCAFKFLVIGNRLVIAPIGDHSELYAMYIVQDEPANTAKTKISDISHEQWWKRNYSVIGAGMVGTNGQITGWNSQCFRIETPHNMRQTIESEVTRLFSMGALTP
jgi:hypothetical protein